MPSSCPCSTVFHLDPLQDGVQRADSRLWGGFGVALVWLWAALLSASAFIILPSAFTPAWLWGGPLLSLGGRSSFILHPSLRGGFGVALVSHWGGFGGALGWL